MRPHPSRAGFRAALILAFFLAAPAAAQVRAAHLTLDNDAYNFWVPTDWRPDQEYTNGLELSLELAGAPVLGRGVARCDGSEAPEAPCAATEVVLGQKIFTPRNDAAVLDAGERPYAGWLYAAATAHRQSAARRRSLGAEVGVTGPPSLGEAVHTAWHRLTGFWEPQGWRNQVGFEPGVAVRYAEALHLDAESGQAGRVLALVPSAGAEAGNVRTAAEAGVQLRAGWRVPHPWSPAADRAHGPASLYVLAGARGEAVAHDLFLDGTTFGDGPRVEREPLVGRWELGAGLRWRAVTLEFRTDARSRAYTTEPGGHQYSTFVLTYRFR